MTAAAVVCEELDDLEQHNNCRTLWACVLREYLHDATRHRQGKSRANTPDYVLEQAFDDLCRCGPMIRHICNHTHHNPVALSEGFIRWCEKNS